MTSPAKIARVALLLLSLGCLPAASLWADGKMEPPVPVRTVPPEVPYDFVRAGEAGLVTVNFLVDEQGTVQDPKVEKASAAILEAPAIQAVKKWKFKPARKDGAPVSIRVSIPIKFSVE